MPCYTPLTGYRAERPDPVTGRRGITFSAREGYSDLPVQVSCGQCIGCRLERSRQWALRCMHEASGHMHNCFITLTYAPDKLPEGETLVKRHHQLFLKRLRKHFTGRPIRYFLCGEYGDQLKRPHYHAILFGVNFDDRKPWKTGRDGVLETSEVLTQLWGLGHAVIGPVTHATAAYCARYSLKKVNGQQAKTHYRRTDPETGETWMVEPEYIAMSLKPAIGKRWAERYASDCYPSDTCVHKGREFRVPAYYDRLLKRRDEMAYKSIKEERIRRAQAPNIKREQTPHRRAVRMEVKLAQIRTLKREL